MEFEKQEIRFSMGGFREWRDWDRDRDRGDEWVLDGLWELCCSVVHVEDAFFIFDRTPIYIF